MITVMIIAAITLICTMVTIIIMVMIMVKMNIENRIPLGAVRASEQFQWGSAKELGFSNQLIDLR